MNRLPDTKCLWDDFAELRATYSSRVKFRHLIASGCLWFVVRILFDVLESFLQGRTSNGHQVQSAEGIVL